MGGITLEEARTSGLLGKLCRPLDKDKNPLGAYAMSTRLANSLANAFIDTVAQLVVLKPAHAEQVKNLGPKKAIPLLQALLEPEDLSLGMEFADDLIDHLNAWLAERDLPPLDSWGLWSWRGSPHMSYRPPPEPPPVIGTDGLLLQLDGARRLLEARRDSPTERETIEAGLAAWPQVVRAIQLLQKPLPSPS